MTMETIREIDAAGLPSLTALQAAIIQAGVPILDRDDVEVYQATVRHTLAIRLWRKGTIIEHAMTSIPMMLLIAPGVAFSESPSPIWSSIGVVWLFLLGLVSAMVHAATWHDRKLCKPTAGHPDLYAAWREETFHSYADIFEVPGAIAERAAMATKAGAYVCVEWLADDPFLTCYLDGDRYYVGVWNEQGFR